MASSTKPNLTLCPALAIDTLFSVRRIGQARDERSPVSLLQAAFQVGGAAALSVAGLSGLLATAQTPAAHASSHAPGGADALAVDAAVATGSLRTLGSGAQQACAGNDSRLSNARTPTAHAASHQSGGSDALALDALGAPSDVTTLNVSISAHGLMPKLPNDATKYLDGTGAYSKPAGSGIGGSTGATANALLTANGTGGATAQATSGSANALFSSTGILQLGGTGNAATGLQLVTDHVVAGGGAGAGALGIMRPDGGAYTPLVCGALVLTDGAGTGTAQRQVCWDMARMQLVYGNAWTWGWYSGANDPGAGNAPDVSLGRGAAGVLAVNGSASNDGAAKIAFGGGRAIGLTETAANATTTEYPLSGDWGLHKNTTTGITMLIRNDGGTLKSAALA